MFKAALFTLMFFLSGCGSYTAYSPPPTPQQQAANMQLINLGAYYLNQANAAPPPPQTTNCISRVVGGQIHTTCY